VQRKVTLQINGKQKYPEGHEDHQELITVGAYYERNGVFYVVYKIAIVKVQDLKVSQLF
jgi:uncharacterized beta-barrel protein YwiB (DUF1934 family)